MINDSTLVQTIPLSTLSFSPLVNDYLHSKDSLRECYESFDTTLEELLPIRIQQTQQYRSLLTTVFTQHIDTIPLSVSQKKSLQLFSDSNAAVIVTGQQAAVLGGPFYTWSKIAHAIVRAKQASEKLNHPVIPVFWLEDNDHDAKEAGIAHWFDEDYSVQEVYYSSKRETNTTISEMKLDESVEEFLNNILTQKKYPFTAEQVKTILNYHKSGQTVSQSFHQLVHASFKESGLLILRSSDIRKLGGYTAILAKEIENPQKTYDAIQNATNTVLSMGYEQQVQPQIGQLFYHLGTKRNKVTLNAENNYTFHSRTMNKQDFISFFQNEATNFSPSALLRLVSQDVLLPSIEVIMGPGELAYAAQTKHLYAYYSVTQPKFIFRNHCVALFESSIQRALQKENKPLRWLFTNAQEKENELFATFDEEHQISERFLTKRKQLAQELSDFYGNIIDYDPSMIGHLESLQSKLNTLLIKSEKKVLASVKRKNTLRLNKIRLVSKLIYPKSRHQERIISSAYYLMQFGIEEISKTLQLAFEEKNECLFILTSLSPK